MGDVFPSIKFPELFFGLVAPIGADITETVASLGRTLEGKGYDVIHVKVTDVFQVLESYITPNITLSRTPLAKRFTSHIAYGDQIRESFNDNSILAKLTIQRIVKNRIRLFKNNGSELDSKVAYILYQFKRKEEIDVLRSVYGRLFFQVSVYSRRGARVDALSRRFASSENTAGSNKFR